MNGLEKRVESLEKKTGINTGEAARQYVEDLICAAWEGRPGPGGPCPAGVGKAFADVVTEAWRTAEGSVTDC